MSVLVQALLGVTSLTPGWQCTPEAEGYFPQMTSNPFAFPRVQLALKSAGTERSRLTALQTFCSQSYDSLTIPLFPFSELPVQGGPCSSANTHPGNDYWDLCFPGAASHRGWTATCWLRISQPCSQPGRPRTFLTLSHLAANSSSFPKKLIQAPQVSSLTGLC